MSVKLLNENKVALDIKAPKLNDVGQKHIVLTVYDEEGTIENMLHEISSILESGHSFNVVLDPGDYNKSFFLDGDGYDKIVDIASDEYTE